MTLALLTFTALGGAFGAVVVWLLLRSRPAVLQARMAAAERDLAAARAESARQQEVQAQLRTQVGGLEATLKAERATGAEKLDLLNHASEQLREAFNSLAGEALKSNNRSFLELAKTSLEKFQTEAKGDLEARQKAVEHLVAPIHESLGKVDQKIQQLETARSEAYGGLTKQLQSLVESQRGLETETGNLVRALRAPSVRGRWGEIQLRRVVEIAGMLPYCDFSEQETLNGADGRLRPDLIVKLPGGKSIVVDAKTPLLAYLDAIEATDDTVRRARLSDHARQVRDQMLKLASKPYREQFEATPEFVVMFLPGETFFSAALEQNPGLIEEGVSQGVVMASPTTLIALLRAVAYGWRQEKLARNAQEISVLGKELHDRLRSLFVHMDTLGKGLDRAVEHYNKAIGTLETRVMVSARKFAELGAPVAEEIPEVEPIETTARTLALDWGDDASFEIDEKPVPRTGTEG